MQPTTLAIEEQVPAELRERAAREGLSLSAVTNELLRRGLRETQRTEVPAHRWKVTRRGGPRVDIADRDALFAAMEER